MTSQAAQRVYFIILKMSPPLSQDTVNSVLALLDSGCSYSKIKSQLGISGGSISNIRSLHRPDLKKSTGGRPRKLNPTATRHAVRLVTNQSTVSTRQATKTLCELTGQTIHVKTVRRALKDAGLRPVKKVKKPKHTPRQIAERLAFAEAHKDWTVEDWKHVLWSDETKVNRLGSDGVHWAWARPGEGLSDRLILPTANFGGGSIMFWGCMGWFGTGYGCKLERTLNAQVYRDILREEFTWSMEYLGMDPEEVIYQQDNASAHKAKICLEWFEEQGIELLEWPPNSPDLSPIENLWGELKRRLGEYPEPPGGILELWTRVEEVWNGLETDYCQRLIEGMPERMAMVLKRKGKSIPY